MIKKPPFPNTKPPPAALFNPVPFKTPPFQNQFPPTKAPPTIYQAAAASAIPEEAEEYNPFADIGQDPVQQYFPRQPASISSGSSQYSLATTTLINPQVNPNPTPTMADVQFIPIPSKKDPPPLPPRQPKPRPLPPQQPDFWSSPQGQHKIQKALIKILRYDIQYQSIEKRYMDQNDKTRTFFQTPAVKPMDLLNRLSSTAKGNGPNLHHLRQAIETARNTNDRPQFNQTYTTEDPDTRTADNVLISITDHEAGPSHFEKNIYQIWDLTHWIHVTSNTVPNHRLAYTYYYPTELREFVIKYCNQTADVRRPPIPPTSWPPSKYEDLYKTELEDYDEHTHFIPRQPYH
jgi:hypothetical protein